MKKIIIQAGGRGSRLRHHTWNKPKCLVSFKGKPLLYHLFDKFPNDEFILIGDYSFEQLEKYLEINPPKIKYTLIRTYEKGTVSGIKDALNFVDINDKIVLIWSDLIVNDVPKIDDIENPTIISTSAFTCRWTIQPNNTLKEIPGTTNGVAGLFYFNNKTQLKNIPESGEFVKWFSNNITNFNTINCDSLEELGDFTNIELQNDRAGFSRFFNEVKIFENTVEKRAIDPKYSNLINNELNWYKSISDLGFRRIPKIISNDRYIMERVNGTHAYQMDDLTDRERRAVLADYLDSLINLHDLGTKEAVEREVIDTYINKTINRVNEVSKIIPNFDKSVITVNGKKCKNIFTNLEKFNEIKNELMPNIFTPIHGDPTFSNTLVDKNLRVWFIDPRGSFADPGIWGDPMYDFAKVYYSAVGGYDLFNRRKFKLHIDDETVEILSETPLFFKEGEEIFKEFFDKDVNKIKILHGLIWLALSGYAKDDIDSVIGSFYLGLYYLEEGFSKL